MMQVSNPRFSGQLSKRARKVWLLVHVVTSVGWLGAGAANLALAATALGLGAPEAATLYRSIHVVDAYVVIPAAFSALASGLVLSLGTKWGLFTHWWVVIKLMLTIVVIAFSTFGPGLWIEESLTATGSRSSHTIEIVIGATGNVMAFLLMTALSLYKPRGLVRSAATARTGRPPARTPDDLP